MILVGVDGWRSVVNEERKIHKESESVSDLGEIDHGWVTTMMNSRPS